MVPIIVTILFALFCKTLSVSAVIPTHCVVSCVESAHAATPPEGDQCPFYRLLSKCLDSCHPDQISKQYLKLVNASCSSQAVPRRCVDDCKMEAFDCYISSVREMCDGISAESIKLIYQRDFTLGTIITNPQIDFPAECLALIGIENSNAPGQVAPNCAQYRYVPVNAAHITVRNTVRLVLLTAITAMVLHVIST